MESSFDFSKRKRQSSNDFTVTTVDLQVKLMGDSLKSRLDCEVEAFCSNIQSLLAIDTRTKIRHLSPPQRVPSDTSMPYSEACSSGSAQTEVRTSSEHLDSQTASCQRQLMFQSQIEPNQDRIDDEEILFFHSRLLKLSLEMINTAHEKGIL